MPFCPIINDGGNTEVKCCDEKDDCNTGTGKFKPSSNSKPSSALNVMSNANLLVSTVVVLVLAKLR